jgi:hypothetical protein
MVDDDLTLLTERLRSADECAETIAARVSEIADDVLGLQIPHTPTVVMLDAIERAYHRERIARCQAEASLSRLMSAVSLLLEETGEYDDEGGFVPVPIASLSGQAREDILAWPAYRAAWERASRAATIAGALSPHCAPTDRVDPRDPNHPCAEYTAGEPDGRCESDGHYLCAGCIHRVSDSGRSQ